VRRRDAYPRVVVRAGKAGRTPSLPQALLLPGRLPQREVAARGDGAGGRVSHGPSPNAYSTASSMLIAAPNALASSDM
jgi:hypothetical protein